MLKLRNMLWVVTVVVLFSDFTTGTSLVTSSSRSVTSDLLGFFMCGFQSQPINCIREKAARILDIFEDKVDTEMRSWGEEADQEVSASGRQLSEMSELPSVTGQKLQLALNELARILQNTMSKSEARKKEGGGGIDSITISTGSSGGDGHKKKKKKDKKKKKPANLHIHQQGSMEDEQDDKKDDKGALVEKPSENSEKTFIQGLWVDQELVGPAKTRIKREDYDEYKDIQDARGKRKKKKKAILKLLLLGAVLKAKLSLLLQLFSAHLQVKFFTIALAGLAINIARFYFDLKKGHSPQKVIYYEHAQHQHHYDHDDDHGLGGYWSRSIDIKPNIRQDEITESNDSHQSDELAYGAWSRK